MAVNTPGLFLPSYNLKGEPKPPSPSTLSARIMQLSRPEAVSYLKCWASEMSIPKAENWAGVTAEMPNFLK
jgi:hypothetical protein